VTAPAPLPLLHLTLGLVLAGWTLLFLFRIVLTWYPAVDLTKGGGWGGCPPPPSPFWPSPAA
jgi:hypothetical protein